MMKSKRNKLIAIERQKLYLFFENGGSIFAQKELKKLLNNICLSIQLILSDEKENIFILYDMMKNHVRKQRGDYVQFLKWNKF